jgi:hypothetical protein
MAAAKKAQSKGRASEEDCDHASDLARDPFMATA